MPPEGYEPDPRDMTCAELLARGYSLEFTVEHGFRAIPPAHPESQAPRP